MFGKVGECREWLRLVNEDLEQRRTTVTYRVPQPLVHSWPEEPRLLNAVEKTARASSA
jgi:hypothetical protein